MKYQLVALVALCLLPAALATISALTATVKGFTFTSNIGAGFTSAMVYGRYTGLSTNLVLNTDYNVAIGGGAGAWTVTITNLDTGNYTWSDDNTNFTPASGMFTLCASPDLPAITLNTGASSTFQAASTRLRLRLRFDENNRYEKISYRHKGGENNCNSSITSYGDTTYQAWNRTSSTASCTAPYTVVEFDFNWALANCNYYRDETDANNTVFNGTILITTVDTGVVIRGARYARTLETAVTVKIGFQTNVSATSGSVSVFGPRITYSAITQQLWNPATLTATLTLITSVQWPYQLATSATQVTATVPGDWTTKTLAAAPADSGADLNGATWNNRAKCYQTTGPTSSGGTVQTSGNVCNQYWEITLVRSLLCNGANTVTLAGSFSIAWNVTCPTLFTGACNAPSPLNDAVTFTTNSTNYCPQLIANNNLNTATLSSYSNNGYSTGQTQFVFGTTTYFEAVITSPILMSHVAVEYVYLTAGGTIAAANPYYSRAYSGAPGTYFAGTPAGTYAGSTVTACASQSYQNAAAMTVTDSADGAGTNALSKKVRFSILWNSCSSAATGDSPTSTTVQVNIRIRYTNQTTVALPTLMSLTATQPHVLADGDGASATANVGVIGQSGTTVTPAASASESSAAMVYGIIAGVAALTAIVVVAAVVIVRRNNRNKGENPQMSSVNLTSTSSTA